MHICEIEFMFRHGFIKSNDIDQMHMYMYLMQMMNCDNTKGL
jgi:hypothetical protein